jgi:hypothetical protein
VARSVGVQNGTTPWNRLAAGITPDIVIGAALGRVVGQNSTGVVSGAGVGMSNARVTGAVVPAVALFRVEVRVLPFRVPRRSVPSCLCLKADSVSPHAPSLAAILAWMTGSGQASGGASAREGRPGVPGAARRHLRARQRRHDRRRLQPRPLVGGRDGGRGERSCVPSPPGQPSLEGTVRAAVSIPPLPARRVSRAREHHPVQPVGRAWLTVVRRLAR